MGETERPGRRAGANRGRAASLFTRYEGNPILTADQWPYPTNSVFNPGAIDLDGETLLLARVEDMRGFSHLTAARSKDGKTDWRIDPQPTLAPDPKLREEQWGLEDARIVRLEEEGVYAVTYVSFSPGGPLVSLATTEDFRTFKRYGPLVPPEDKDACLFPRKFKVICNQPSELTRTLSTMLDQPFSHQFVVNLSQTFQHTLVGHIPQDGMLEGVFGCIYKRRFLTMIDQLTGS